MSKKQILLAVTFFCGTIGMAQDSTHTKQLDEAVVTATKFPIKQMVTGKVVIVITKEMLEKSAGKTISEILTRQAGIYINGAENTFGTNQDIYMRGAGTGKTLILVDGIPVYDPSGISSGFDVNFFTSDQVERIEIVKGSQSTLYGSDAVAGIINIITKKGGDKPVQIIADLAAGSYHTYKASAGINGKINNTSYNAQYTKFKSNGISSAYDSNRTGKFDNDGYNQDALIAGIQQQVSGNLKVHVSGQYSAYKTGLDAGAYTDDLDYNTNWIDKQLRAGADYTGLFGAIHFNYQYNTIDRNYLDDSLFVGGFSKYTKAAYNGRSHFTELYGNIHLEKNMEILLGMDYRKQVTDQDYFSISSYGPYRSTISGDSAKVKQFAAYGSFVLKDLSGFNLEVGGRYNKFSQYGTVFTYSINPSYVINEQLKFFANLSSGFKAPTLYQLYSEYANPKTALKPEKSLSLEAGAQYTKGDINLRATWFLRDVKDNIVFYSGGAPDYANYYINADRQKDRGVEVEATARFNKLHLALNYTFVTGRFITTINAKDSSYNNLYRRPKNTVNAEVGLDVCKKLYLALNMRAVGRRQEAVFGGTPVELASYYTVNGYAQYQVSRQVKVFFDGKNITNQEFFDVPGYTSRRFNFMAGVNMNF